MAKPIHIAAEVDSVPLAPWPREILDERLAETGGVSRILVVGAGLVLLVSSILLGFETRWEACTVCLEQQYVRTLFGIEIVPISGYGYDEWGTVEVFHERCGPHFHRFAPVEPGLAARAATWIPGCAEGRSPG